jgi:hypothetical protein
MMGVSRAYYTTQVEVVAISQNGISFPRYYSGRVESFYEQYIFNNIESGWLKADRFPSFESIKLVLMTKSSEESLLDDIFSTIVGIFFFRHDVKEKERS